MMRLKSFTSNWKEIEYRLIFLLMGAQIILGALWFFCNLTGVQAFPEAEELLEISGNWVLDDYVGIAYPAVLWLLQKIFGGWYTLPLYLLQLGAVFGAACFFLGKAGIVKKKEDGKLNWKLLWGAAYVTTMPMIMQFAAAQLPYAFALGAFLMVLGECFFLCKKAALNGEELWKNLGVLGMGFSLGALFIPDYIWIMAVPVLVSFVVFMWRSRKGYPLMLVAFVMVFCLNMFAAEAYHVPGSRGRMEKSISATLLRRCVWPNFERDYFFWSHNVKILFPAEDMISVSCEPENVLYDFGYKMEETYGKELADEEYMLMVRSEWEVRTKELVREIALDMTGYLCPQLMTYLQLQGDAVSYSGWSYHFMSANTPFLTKVYWNVSEVCFLVLLALQVLAGVVRVKVVKKKIWQGAVLLPVVTVLWMAAWYGMQAAGMWDYRNVIPIVALWAAGIVFTWCYSLDEEKENA